MAVADMPDRDVQDVVIRFPTRFQRDASLLVVGTGRLAPQERRGLPFWVPTAEVEKLGQPDLEAKRSRMHRRGRRN